MGSKITLNQCGSVPFLVGAAQGSPLTLMTLKTQDLGDSLVPLPSGIPWRQMEGKEHISEDKILICAFGEACFKIHDDSRKAF